MSKTESNSVIVMVIDDQLGKGDQKDDRIHKYKEFIKQINHELAGKWVLNDYYCDDPGAVAKIPQERDGPALAIVDMVLNTSAWTSDMVSRLDRRLISEHWPMLLVSAQHGSPEAIDRANRLVEEASAKKNPFQFLIWSSIDRAAQGVEIKNLAFIIDSVLSRSRNQDLRFRKKPDDPIDILHITDPHFGKATWDVGTIMSLRTKRKQKMDPNNTGLDPSDFLAITGDIANQGTPEEYSKAMAYFNALANNNVVTRTESGIPQDRVFLCPGNHDFSRRISLGANIKDDNGFTIEKTMDPDYSWVRSFAWAPYEQFEAAIAGHMERWIPNPGFRINSRFLNTGIIILELNVEQYAIDSYQPGLTDEQILATLNNAATEISKVRLSNECIIVLSHRYESDLWRSLSTTIDNTLRGLTTDGPVILLCGHEHNAKVAPELDGDLFLVRGLPPVKDTSLPDLVLPMISCVRLLRNDGRVSGIEVYKFHRSATDWLTEDKPIRYAYRSKKWQLQV